MAFVEFNCGPCESSMQMDSGENEALDGMVTFLVQRFVDAHAKCGFVTALVNTDQATRPGNVVRVRPRKSVEDEGDTL